MDNDVVAEWVLSLVPFPPADVVGTAVYTDALLYIQVQLPVTLAAFVDVVIALALLTEKEVIDCETEVAVTFMVLVLAERPFIEVHAASSKVSTIICPFDLKVQISTTIKSKINLCR
jgi:hypothetical protein